MEATPNKSSGSMSHPGCTSVCDHDRKSPDIDLLSPLTLRGMTLRNRIVMSPMCQYIAKNGMADDWHLVHLGSRAVGGTALVFVEATSVAAEGRITPGDMGLWTDSHTEPLARIVRFVHSQGGRIGIQLAHAGRKASCDVPWKGGKPLGPNEGAWPILGPSPLAFAPEHQIPRVLDEAGIARLIEDFLQATRRAIQAGFDVIELHGAHGYLIHSFLSPLSNQRTDKYGGTLENRMRFLLELTSRIRAIMPAAMPLFVRISATDWAPRGWDVEQSVLLAKELKKLGVDLIDVSTGGNLPTARIPVGKNYQVPFAEQIRREAEILTGAVGLITEPEQANEIVQQSKADLVFVGRAMLRDPYWAIRAQAALDGEQTWALPYGYAVVRRKH